MEVETPHGRHLMGDDGRRQIIPSHRGIEDAAIRCRDDGRCLTQ